MEFNINNHIKVKLTKIGRQALIDNHNELNDFSGGLLGEYKEPDEDENGWSRWQFWHLMSVIGHKFGNGMNPPIETDIVIEE